MYKIDRREGAWGLVQKYRTNPNWVTGTRLNLPKSMLIPGQAGPVQYSLQPAQAL